MKKFTKNIIGLVLIGVLHYLIVLPIITGENIRLPFNGRMFGTMLIWVMGFPLLSFLIPGIIALVVYRNNKIFWRYFYYTGWIIYIFILFLVSLIIYNLKFMG